MNKRRISFDFEQFVAICSFMDNSDCGEFFKMINDRITGEDIDFHLCENITRLAYSLVDVKIEGENKE